MDRAALGRAGESYAAEEYKRKGYRIKARNYHTRSGELDIVAENEEYIVFAEVKTRTEGYMVSGVEAVNYAKRSRLIRAAWLYLMSHPSDRQPRFDIVDIVASRGDSFSVKAYTLYENAFGVEG